MSIRLNLIAPLSLAAVLTQGGMAYAQSAKAAPGPAAKAAPAPLPRATFITDMEAQFRAIDADRNNILTVTEIQASQRAAAAARNAARARGLFMELDKDKNGQISPAEFTRIPLPSEKPDARPMVARFDTNKDSAVSLIEYRGGTLMNFDRLDTDKDGVVSPTEMRTVGIGR